MTHRTATRTPLRLLRARTDTRWPVTGAGALSVALHGMIIVSAVVGTLPPPGMPADGLSNRIVYMPPPDRPQIAAGPVEHLHFIDVTPGVGVGPGPRVIDGSRGVQFPEQSRLAGERQNDSTTSAPPAEPASSDSVYTLLEVDTAVVRSRASAAPAYPPELIEKHIEGSVVVRFVVDTTGFPDTASFAVMRATDERFVKSLREVLPRMQFSPAKIGPVKVRQLVEQTFSFRITAPVQAPTPRKPN